LENLFGLDLFPVKSQFQSFKIDAILLKIPAKSGKEENSIENETNGARTPEAASFGTVLLTVTAELDGADATTAALKRSETNMVSEK
jgi:hypothetical protein